MTRRVVVASALAALAAAPTAAGAALVVVDPATVLNRFSPAAALGAGLDGHERGDTRRIYTPANERAMASAGFGAISLRLRTELGVEAWHWNPAGTWSDPRHHRGYWTSSASPRGRIAVSYGYRLPRRGDTVDQANDNGYSRLDDGRLATFWKSNPYLDSHYTGERNALHPQWVLIDLGRLRPIDAVRIDWGTPYATRFVVQRYDGPSAIALAGHPPGRWVDFARGRRSGHDGRQTLRVAPAPVPVRFIRVLLLRGSRTAPRGSHDIRDRLGFAIRELGAGTLRGRRFSDLMRHGAGRYRQTVTMASSTDPWHRASDLDRNTEQPGFDTVLGSGLVHAPLMVPVPVLYGTPGDAAAEIRWWRARHVALSRIELGEEPDGQLAAPEDYGALYAEFARALAGPAGRTPLGGPGYQTSIPDWLAWPDRSGDRSWTRRFLAELRRRGALGRLGFFSFEWYPFDNTCAATGPQLARAPRLLAAVIARQRAEGLPARVPLVITEYGYSAFAGRAEVDVAGALLDADLAGNFLSLGGSTAYFYGLEPDQLISELSACSTWGNLALWQTDSARHIKHPLAALWAARLVTRFWAQPDGGAHDVLATAVQHDSAYPSPLSAYAVRRPDGRIAVMLVNRDPARTIAVRLDVGGASPAVDVRTLSGATYRWRPNGPGGYPSPDLPPARSAAPAGATLQLPPYSLTIARTQPPATSRRRNTR